MVLELVSDHDDMGWFQKLGEPLNLQYTSTPRPPPVPVPGIANESCDGGDFNTEECGWDTEEIAHRLL